MKSIALIPARAGSKGIPDKNIVKVGYKTLLEYAVSVALESKVFEDVVVSTDSPEMQTLAVKYGAYAPFLRPHELARDQTPTFPVLQHCLKWLAEKESKHYDLLMLLQPTCPFRSVKDLHAALHILIENSDCDSVVSLCEVEEPHPYKMKIINGKFIQNFVATVPIEQPMRRQDLPKVYALNGGIYLVKVKEMLARGSLLSKHTLPYIMPWERSVNIDGTFDLLLAQALSNQVKG